jgi:hypothetical protein
VNYRKIWIIVPALDSIFIMPTCILLKCHFHTLIPTKHFEDGGTSIFASGDRAVIDAYCTQSFKKNLEIENKKVFEN